MSRQEDDDVEADYRRCKEAIGSLPDERVRDVLLQGLNMWYNHQYRNAYKTLSGCVPRGAG